MSEAPTKDINSVFASNPSFNGNPLYNEDPESFGNNPLAYSDVP